MIRAAVSTSPGAAARTIDLEEALRWPAAPAQDAGSVLWIDCAAPTPEEVRRLEQALGLHPLTVEDLTHRNQREYEAVESLRELAQGVLEVQLAVIERQQNQVIQRLTVLSAVFLPLNFLTGFFGMNFASLPFANPALLVAALPTGLLLWLRYKGWVRV